jgi:dipeptidyl aminopeptidase/acylaminoacyl peptidase
MRHIAAKSTQCLIFVLCVHLFSFSAAVADAIVTKIVRTPPNWCPTLLHSGTERRPITLDDYDCIQDLPEARISGDGKHVAYVTFGQVHIRTVDTQNDWIPSLPDNEASWSPVWSTDSQSVFFLSGSTNMTRVWKQNISSRGSPVQLSCFHFSVDFLKLNPDGYRLLLELNDAPVKSPQIPPKDSCLVAATTSEPMVISGMIFKDSGGYIEKRNRVFVVDFTAAPVVSQVTRDTFFRGASNHDTDSAWSDDGKSIVFVREYPARLRYESEIWIASPTTSTATKLTSSRALRRLPLWSDDGETIAYLHSESDRGPYGIERLAIYSLKAGAERILTRALSRTVTAFRFSHAGKHLFFVYADRGGQHLARVRLADGRIDYLVHGEQEISGIDTDDHERVLMIMNTMDDLPDLYLRNVDKTLTRLTRLNQAYLDSVKIAPKMKLNIRDPDGSIYESFVTKPIDSTGGRNPAVLNLHGGPIDEQHTYGFEFFAQNLAANGYVVVEPNVPGSLGRSQRSNMKIYRNWGCVKYPKALLAVDRLVSLGMIDPRKLGVTGYSYGGYMTNCIITRTPRKFKAAASGGGHSAVAANFGHDQWIKWYSWELGVPWKNKALYAEISPLSRVGCVKTPTLFLAGEQDWNVPILNSELFYQALRMRGIKSQLIAYKGGHAGWGSELDKDYYSRILKWFNDHIK